MGINIINMICKGFAELVGKTPMVYLGKISKAVNCEIYAKAEFMNPGGSVKDRAARYMLEQAENKGLLKAGDLVIEGTAGNTGIGLAHLCNAKSYRCKIYMPETQSKEKVEQLQVLGAEVVLVPVYPFDDNRNYNHQARIEASRHDNAIWTNQFDNVDNMKAHLESTGPEMWEQMSGQFDGFICATGTGGTFAGVSSYLKSKTPGIKCFIADPPGSVLYNYAKCGKLERTGMSSITEGIGQGRITLNFETAIKNNTIDDAIHIPDEKTILMVYRLLAEEGLFVGASSGTIFLIITS
jgi:cysteine synthase